MLSRRPLNNGSIVLRLRISFLAIFLGLAAVGMFSHIKLSDISMRKNDLTERAIPLLVRAQDLVALLSIQSQQVTALRDIDTTANFDEISQIATQRQEQFNERLTLYQGFSSDQGLSRAADRFFASTQTLIDLQTQRQTLARLQSERLSDLSVVIDAIEIKVEGFRLDVLTQFQASLDQIAVDTAALDDIGPISLQLNSLVTLGLLIERMQNLAQSNVRNQSVAGSAENIRFMLREILAHVSRIPPSAQRDTLAQDIALARALILGEDGILSIGTSRAGVRTDITQSVATSFAHIQDIETEIAKTIDAASSGAQDTSAALNQSIQTLRTSNLATTLLLFGGLILIVIFIVEGQLNTRVQSLIASIRRFADGNFEDEIAVIGADELGEVADSLRLSQSVSRDLQRSNSDLKSFAYAASHDLKTPLRAITDLADWTLEDAGDELSDQSRQNLTLLSNRSNRLSNLLDGLLLYAQVDGMTTSDDLFNMQEECAGIADLIDPDHRFEVVVDPPILPFSTTAIPLRQILNNLISNAIKHHDRPTGTITVRSKLTSHSVEIQVQDDGPGIPPIYHDKIFELFQKLESADVVEGAGIGLALVKKLAERHGGGVQLQSNENGTRGAVFSIILSARPGLAPII